MKFLKWIKRIVLSVVLLVIGAMALRLYDIQRGPDLQLWHTYVPHEMSADEIEKADWIGITSFARFSGVAGWPAVLPAFAKAAWLNIMPEFNPFKFNSFPTNAARQSFLLTSALQSQIATDARNKKLDQLPPILTFQSAMDSTVSARAIITALYNRLPDNHSEVVLFDLNHAVRFNALLRRSSYTALARLLPAAPRRYTTTVITNVTAGSTEMESRTLPAGKTEQIVEKMDLRYLPDVYSLSHVALPFPLSDSLYGRYPDPVNQYGISLGTFAARGERAVLVVGLDSLMRQSSNPFFPYMIQRIDEGIAAEAPGTH